MNDDHDRWRPPGQRRSDPVIPPVTPSREDRYVWQDRIRDTAPSVPSVHMLDPIVRTAGLSRDYQMGGATIQALKPLDLVIERGQLVAIHGRSGSGKTTLLNLIGGLDRPTKGSAVVDGTDVTTATEAELVELRRFRVGFIFQTFGLIPILSAAENVEVPLRLANIDVGEREERVRVLLELVGLGERAQHRPHELSGGEQQRVAIARALANTPRLLLADEPTGQLDSGTARTIMTLLRALVKSEGVTAIVATHDPILIDLADRVLELRDGRILSDSLER